MPLTPLAHIKFELWSVGAVLEKAMKKLKKSNKRFDMSLYEKALSAILEANKVLESNTKGE